MTSLLTTNDKLCIIDQALLLLKNHYVHLPQKKATYAILPEQRLINLKRKVKRQDDFTDIQFHRQMLRIFNSLRDLHTRYIMPADPNQSMMALPFQLEACYKQANNQDVEIIVTRTIPSNPDIQKEPNFIPGIKILAWNGAPILKVIDRLSEQSLGGNEAARFAHALRGLTQCDLQFNIPPDEEWVIVEYETSNGNRSEARFYWQIFSDSVQMAAGKDHATGFVSTLGVDMETERLYRLQLEQFPKDRSKQDLSSIVDGAAEFQLSQEIQSQYPESFAARWLSVTRNPGDQAQNIGYLRIYSFSTGRSASYPYPNTEQEFISEIERLFRIMASQNVTGLIIDVRSNPGGNIRAAEQLLQTLSQHPIAPENFQMLCSEANLELCNFAELGQWKTSIELAEQSANLFSSAYSISMPKRSSQTWNNGPIVVIVDAFSYSATDMFAAGILDNQIGQVIGVDDNTGAGGANVVPYNWIVEQMSENKAYQCLPANVSMRVALRRSLRVGQQQEEILEDFGVKLQRYYLTYNDLMNKNADLLNFAAEQITSKISQTQAIVQDSSNQTQPTITGQSNTSETLLNFFNPQSLLQVQISNLQGKLLASGQLDWK